MPLLTNRRGSLMLMMAAASASAAPVPARAAPSATSDGPPWEPFTPGSGRTFTVPCVDNLADLFGDIVDPDLVVFYGGNQFMAVPDLLQAFRAAHPNYSRILIETLPPGVLADQIEQGALVIGNLRIAVKPDVFIAGKSRIERMQREQGRFEKVAPINRSRIGLMVRSGNPLGIGKIADLGRSELRVAMPNPAWEGIGRQVEDLYRQAGGEALARRVMQEKLADGTTVLTDIHHRQTPMRIMAGNSDVGPVWETEVHFQRRLGHPLELVALPQSEARVGTTHAATLADAPHPRAARDFLDFLTSPGAQTIYAKHGFMPPAS